MDFQEAQSRFTWLEGQLRAGQMNEGQYQAALNELRVTDAWGRLWMLQAHSGVWHVYQNGAWVPAQPPLPVAPVPPAPAPVQPAPRKRSGLSYTPVAPKKQTSTAYRYLRMLVIWAVIWALIAAGFWLFYGSSHQDEAGDIFLGIGAAALLSLVLTLWTMRGGWKGQVMEIRVEEVKTYDDDGMPEKEKVSFAFVRMVDGKVRKMRAMPDWQVGDWLEKKQGNNWVERLNS